MIAIITYNAPHRKTQDLISKLLILGHRDIHLLVLPWKERKNFLPIFLHRPNTSIKISIDKLSKNLDIKYTLVTYENIEKTIEKHSFNHILIAGAGILPETLSKKYKIINSHPAYLPNVRGLDALKWAIYNNETIGVTTHFITDKADEGLSIERKIVPVYFEDSFYSVAYRQYEMEIEMLANTINIIEQGNAELVDLANDSYKPNRRMPHHLEMIMLERFNELRKKSKSHREIIE